MSEFFANYGLIILLAVLLVFMFWSSRRRMQKQKLEQEQRARNTVPGAEVLLQGGLYGTIVSYDADNLDQPAIVELAPGVQIKVHSQAILRIVEPTAATVTEDEAIEHESIAHESIDPADTRDEVVIAEDTRETTDPDAETGTKPQA